MRITALTTSGELVKVVVDNKLLGLVASSVVLELELRPGQEITAIQHRHLKEAVEYMAFYRAAGRYCSRRLRSRAEAEAYLAKLHCPLSTAGRIADRLLSDGLINETQLAAALIHDAGLRRPMSRISLTKKLQDKHLNPELVSQALDAAGTDDERALLAVIAKKQRQPSYVNNKPRLFRYLLRQGFAYTLIVKHLGSPY